MAKKNVIPQEDEARKAAPMYRGVLGYFPGALFVVASHSMASDQKHNGDLSEKGAPRWRRAKSSDHDDCIIRHTAEQHTDPLYHKTARAWRALADLQEYLEREHGYAPGAHSYPEPEPGIEDFDLMTPIPNHINFRTGFEQPLTKYNELYPPPPYLPREWKGSE